PADHLRPPARLALPALQVAVQVMVVVLAVRPEDLQPRVALPPQLVGQGLRRLRVVHRGAGDRDGQQQAHGVHGDVALFAVAGDLAGVVEAGGAARLGALDRLAVDAAGRRGRLPASRHPDALAEGVVEPAPGAALAPLGEVVVDGLPRAVLLG